MNRSTSSEIFRPRRARPALPRAAGSTRHGAHAAIDFHGACCTVVADLLPGGNMHRARQHAETRTRERRRRLAHEAARLMAEGGIRDYHQAKLKAATRLGIHDRSEEHTSELKSLMRISYAVCCMTKNNKTIQT